MLRSMSVGLLVCGIATLMNLMPASAQNYFTGGDFESPVQTHVGDNIVVLPAPWVSSGSAVAGGFQPISIVRVEGPNGTVPTIGAGGAGGNALLQALPRSDASNSPVGQYARGTYETGGYNHGQRIVMPTDGCVKFSGKFSNAHTAATAVQMAIVEQSPAFLTMLQNTPAPGHHFDPMSGAMGQPVSFQHEWISLPAGAVWEELAQRLTVTANTTYAFGFMLTGRTAGDDIAVEYVPAEQCDPNWTPPAVTFDPSQISTAKACTAPTSVVHNGQVGQQWDCTVEVTVPDAPFVGAIDVTDIYTSIATTASDVIASGSASGNFDCSAGATCTIEGSDFDASGTETLNYSVFVTATELQDTYPMQNCVEGSYDDGLGFVTPVAGNCVSAQWVPRSSIDKTCDPIEAVISGPMTLNCQLEVTGTNLATGSYVLAADAFGALPHMTPTIVGTMMNVTSTEPWACYDANLNAPSSSGICELSAEDMLLAGGTSTLNVSFDFTVDQVSGPVVNCPITDILPISIISAAGQRHSGPPVRSPQTDTLAGLPDNCAIVDVPTATSTPKIEKVEIKKICETPLFATVQGAQGYTWDCRAEIEVIPTPFSGTFTFDDDASSISIGSAQFISASEPNCTGLLTDHLQCQLDGATIATPHVVSYQLFTELVDPNQPIEWKNCVEGFAETAAGTFPSNQHCVNTVIKPEIVIVDPEPKEITLEKSCGRPSVEEHDGQTGIGWDCAITVTASPAPFSGTFTFTEDASAVTGSSNANIVNILQQSNNWSCTPSVPTSSTDCTISGADFDPSGVETLAFHLFAQTGNEPIEWRNCVNGVHTSPAGKPRDIKGNCEGTTWKPTVTPPTFDLKKGCRLAGEQGENTFYQCSIYIQQTGGAPVTDPLIFDELFSTTSGTAAPHYIFNLQGTPAMPNGWDCGQAPYTTGASCTIAAADFNSNSNHRIDAYLSIPTSALGKDDFENCAQVRIGDQIVGSADCVLLDEPVNDTTFDVEKTCKASGERTVMGPTTWFQPYQCTIAVTTNGVPFTGPLWIMEDLHFGQHPGAAAIQNITSADPWDCSTPPYAPIGQGTAPYCGIQGSQFPSSGTSTLTVDMVMNGAMDMFGAENCVDLSLGEPTATGLPAPIASDCFEIAPAPKASLDLTKKCEPAVRGANGQWTAQCVVTVSGSNLPAGQAVRITDELTASGNTVATAGSFNGGPFTQQNCGGFAVLGGVGVACDLTTDQIMANGGSISLPYTAVLTSAGLLNNTSGQNCAFADIPSAGIHAPTAGNGKSCVPIPLELSAVPATDVLNTGPILNPYTPTPQGCGFDTLFVVDTSGSMNVSNRIGLTKQAVIAALHIFEGGGAKSGAISFNTGANVAGGTSLVLPSASLEAAIQGFSAGGGTNWADGFGLANSAVTPLADKPLVFFISDGSPNRPAGPSGSPPSYYMNAAAPALTALRAQGSQVVGVALGGAGTVAMTQFIGPNIVSTGGSVAIDPATTDVINIVSEAHIIPAFEAIAQAYCPSRPKMTAAERENLEAALQAVPKSEGVYLGDDEPPADAEPTPADTSEAAPILPLPTPTLAISKTQTSACTANRASQTYDCGFRLNVTNTGTGPYVGPLTVTDTVGAPGVKSASLISDGGWTCAGPVGNGIACDNQLLNLAAGASTHLDLSMKINALRRGGDVENCGAVGIPDNRTQRVAAIQQVMNNRGMNAGPVDGKPGKKTYAALTQLQTSLGLPVSTEFGDDLFAALGLPLQTAGEESCVFAQLAPMPAPPLQCNAATTVKSGESCACRYDNMQRRNATSCQCPSGFDFVTGEGCIKRVVSEPVPAPAPADLVCDKRSTRSRDGSCVCIDQKNAVKTSSSSCGCKSGGPMIGGRCLSISITPGVSQPDVEHDDIDSEPQQKCKIRLNGICIK